MIKIRVGCLQFVVGLLLVGLVMVCCVCVATVMPAFGAEDGDVYLPIIARSGPTLRPTPTLAPTMDPRTDVPLPTPSWTPLPTGLPGYCISIGPWPTPTPTGPHCFIGTPPGGWSGEPEATPQMAEDGGYIAPPTSVPFWMSPLCDGPPFDDTNWCKEPTPTPRAEG
jgi:hypothetical protein